MEEGKLRFEHNDYFTFLLIQFIALSAGSCASSGNGAVMGQSELLKLTVPHRKGDADTEPKVSFF